MIHAGFSVSACQLEAFYSIFTTEQQDHVKSVEYLRNNYRPLQHLDSRKLFKSSVKDAWQRDLTDVLLNPHATEATRGTKGYTSLTQRTTCSVFMKPTLHPFVVYMRVSEL